MQWGSGPPLRIIPSESDQLVGFSAGCCAVDASLGAVDAYSGSEGWHRGYVLVRRQQWFQHGMLERSYESAAMHLIGSD